MEETEEYRLGQTIGRPVDARSGKSKPSGGDGGSDGLEYRFGVGRTGPVIQAGVGSGELFPLRGDGLDVYIAWRRAYPYRTGAGD